MTSLNRTGPRGLYPALIACCLRLRRALRIRRVATRSRELLLAPRDRCWYSTVIYGTAGLATTRTAHAARCNVRLLVNTKFNFRASRQTISIDCHRRLFTFWTLESSKTQRESKKKFVVRPSAEVRSFVNGAGDR